MNFFSFWTQYSFFDILPLLCRGRQAVKGTKDQEHSPCNGAKVQPSLLRSGRPEGQQCQFSFNLRRRFPTPLSTNSQLYLVRFFAPLHL